MSRNLKQNVHFTELKLGVDDEFSSRNDEPKIYLHHVTHHEEIRIAHRNKRQREINCANVKCMTGPFNFHHDALFAV